MRFRAGDVSAGGARSRVSEVCVGGARFGRAEEAGCGVSPGPVLAGFRCCRDFLDRRRVTVDQLVRQQARARARQARAKVRQGQAKRERRWARWGEAVAVALAERDAAMADCEQRAGRALRSLIEEEGLNTQEALAWCGDDTLTGREVYRLIRGVADGDQDGGQSEDTCEDRGEDAPASVETAEDMPG